MVAKTQLPSWVVDAVYSSIGLVVGPGRKLELEGWYREGGRGEENAAATLGMLSS